MPSVGLRKDHRTEEEGEEVAATYSEMFSMSKWSRTGQVLSGFPHPCNTKGEKLCHGSVIDFDSVPIEYIHDDALVFWLAVRQIQNSFQNRDELVRTVNHLRTRSVELRVLPSFLLRGSAGYVTFEVLTARDPNGAVTWLRRQEALSRCREWYIPKIDDDYFYSIFKKRNSVRQRCLKHVKSGSFDLKDFKVTSGLRSNMRAEKELFVVQALCAPSQRLGSGVLYTVTLVFCVDENEQTSIYQQNPHSKCDCENGAWFCAHMGALVLMLFVFQQTSQTMDFDTNWTMWKWPNLLPTRFIKTMAKSRCSLVARWV
jgi:hypothetical protein